MKELERTQQRHLRQIMRIRWYHRVSNIEVLSRAKCLPIEVLVSRSRLRWVGHIQRMQDNRLEKCIFYSELCQGSCRQGGQRTRYKDVLHRTMKSMNISVGWEDSAADRNEWRRIVASCTAQQQHHKNNYSAGSLECPECDSVISSRIGLFSHRRTHL